MPFLIVRHMNDHTSKNTNPDSLTLLNFFARYEDIMLDSIEQTVKVFAPQQALEFGDFLWLLEAISVALITKYPHIITSIEDEELKRINVVTVGVSVTLQILDQSKVSFAIPLCPQWTPIEASKFIYDSNHKKDNVAFLLDRHKSTCSTCQAYYSTCLSITNETLRKSKHSLLCDEYWLDSKTGLVDLYGKPNDEVKAERKVLNYSKYKYPLLALCATVFLLFLAGVIYIIGSKQVYSSQPFSVRQEYNLYQYLDLSLDQYLETSDPKHLEKAKSIAERIASKYDDQWGKDVVKSYSVTSIDKSLLKNRLQLLKLLNSPITDDFLELRKQSEALVKFFTLRGNSPEAYRAKSVLEKVLTMQDNQNYKVLYSDGMEYANSKNYKYLELHFKLWDLKYRSSNLDNETEKDFESFIAEAKSLDLDELASSAMSGLAGICELTNRDEKALSLAEDALRLSQAGYGQTISLLQIAGISSCKLKNYEKGNEYLQQALKVGNQYKDTHAIILAYNFLGTMKTSQGETSEAEKYFTKAENLLLFIKDEMNRKSLEGLTIGYRAKNEFQKQNYLLASELYQKSLNDLTEVQGDNDMYLSELNEGLAVALEKLGNNGTEKYRTIAEEYKRRADQRKEKVSCFLSFVPAQCK